MAIPHTRLPEWIKIHPGYGANYLRVKGILKSPRAAFGLSGSACPNIRECFDEGTATFMILGHHCTRGCNFCDVLKAQPIGLDEEEPARLADVVAELKLKQVVITSVTRDDLPDGGAAIFARTIELLRRQDKKSKSNFSSPISAAILTPSQPYLIPASMFSRTMWRRSAACTKRVRGAAKLDRSLAVLRLCCRLFAVDRSSRPDSWSGWGNRSRNWSN